MAKNTTPIAELRIPSGSEIYDALMGQIEPELVTSNLDTLDEKYVGETPEARKERYARYDAAYAAYDEAFESWVTELKTSVTQYRRDVLRAAEQESRASEDAQLSSLESQFVS